MKLYEINEELQRLLDDVDPETGELLCDADRLTELAMARDEKLENLACAVKNYEAEATAIREEEKRLADRRRVLENKAANAKAYLADQLNGEKLTSSRVSVGWRRTEAVDLTPGFLAWAKLSGNKYLRTREPEPDRVALKAALKAGETIPGAQLISRQSMLIK